MSSLAKYFNRLDFHQMHPDTTVIRTTNALFTVHTLTRHNHNYSAYICVVPGPNKYRLEYTGYIKPDQDLTEPLVLQGYHSNIALTIEGKRVLDYGERKSFRRDTIAIPLKKGVTYPFSLTALFNNDEGSVRLNFANDFNKDEIPTNCLLDAQKVEGQVTAKYYKETSNAVFPDVIRAENSIHHQVSEPSPFVTEEDVRVCVLETRLPKGKYNVKWINPELNALISEYELEVNNDVALLKTPYFIFDVVLEIQALKHE